jgi:CHASE1-domain containing sensor protein
VEETRMDGRVFILPARLIGGVLLLIALLLIGLAVWQVVSVNQFIAEAVRTEGTVIGLAGADMKQSVFAFQDEHAATHVARSRVASDPPAYDVGDTVPVLYDRDDP